MLYVHGFDPRGPAPYHRIFTAEAARQAAVDGDQIAVGERRALSPIVAEWEIAAVTGGQATQVGYTVLRWDDVARGLWTRGNWALWRELRRWVADFRISGAFAYAHAGARPGYWAMMTPPLVVAAFAILTAIAMGLAAWLGARAVSALGGPAWAGLGGGILPLLVLPVLWRHFDGEWNISWLSRCFAFIALGSRGASAALLDRATIFAAEIVAACDEPACDEVLIVGHSQGAPVAIMALARALARRPDLGLAGPRLSLLTLGQPISIWNFLAPAQGGVRADVARVRDAAQVFWLDVTSPSDSVSACGLSPLDVVGQTDPERPARRSPQFHMILSPARFRHIRMRPFAYHFQYLHACEAPKAYSYFRMVCGPALLEDFHAGWTVATADE